MKRAIFTLTLIFLLALAGGAGAITGLALPFSGDNTPTLEQIEKLLKEKRYEQASIDLSFLILLQAGQEGEPNGRALTYLGQALLGMNHPDQAAEIFHMASTADPEIGDAAALYRIKALEQARKYDDALAAIAEFRTNFPASAIDDGLGETRARILHDAGRHPEAAKAYLALADCPPDLPEYGQYRILAARSFLNAENPASAKKCVEEILLNAPPGRFTEEATEMFRSLNGSLLGEMYTNALDWYKDGSYRQAVPILRDLVEKREQGGAGNESLHELRAKLAFALFSIHANEESLKQYNILIENRGADDRAHSLYRKAKLLTRMGDNEASAQVFRQILREHGGSGYVPAARYQLALIDMEDNRYKEAYQYFKWRLTKPGGPREYLTWLAAWCAYRNDYLDTAAGYLDELLSKYKRSGDRDRYRFWRARIYASKKEPQKAVDIYRSINSASPLTYYGHKSYEELRARKLSGRSIQGVLANGNPKLPEVPAISAGWIKEEDQGRFRRVEALTRAGMADEAIEEIAILAAGYEKEETDVLYGLAGLFRQNGGYNQAIRLANKTSFYNYCKGFSDPIGACYFSITFPIGFSELVEPYAKLRKIPPEIVYALIHQESTYRPQVVSPAHAIGLMQIVPRTGREIAADLKVETFSEEDLYDPVTNVRFGTWYLAKMLKRFDNKLPCALASYNAGPDVVSKWNRNKGALPDEIFIEEIPYQETNNYVKKILKNIDIYKALLEIMG